MALSNLTASITLGGTITSAKATDLATPSETLNIGTGSFDAMTLSLTFGSGSGAANQLWYDERTVTATTEDNLDLAGVLTNSFGETVTFSAIKFALIAIDSPNGTKALRVGPRGVSAAWQGPFGGVTSVVYKEVYEVEILVWNSYSGHTVTATTADILGIYNPGGTSVTYRVLLIGVSA